MMEKQFLPLTRQEMLARGWERPDFCLVTGDAYVDHPSFGTAIIGRVLESQGFKVAVIAQPDWKSVRDFQRFGRPRLGFLVNSGNIDSMVCHYTASKKRRSDDAYTPGGKTGARPDRAVIVYTNMIRQAYRNMPIIIGGIEASLRRFAHYDYWDDKVRRSILVDAGADLLIYGMGERPVVELAQALAAGIPIGQITYVNGTCYQTASLQGVDAVKEIESFEQVRTDKQAYARAFLEQHRQTDAIRGQRLAQKHGDGYLVMNPPAMPLSVQEMDAVYALPYMRAPHPSYTEHIPGVDEVEFSITSCRGCYGGCSFCALTYHQGRRIQVRSHASIVDEAIQMTKSPHFKGYIHDVGGPTANFRQTACKQQRKNGVCPDRACLYPRCPNLEVDHEDYRKLLVQLRKLPGIKKVFVRSGLRYDYMMYDTNDAFFRELVEHHISGQLKVAPEHISDRVLARMGKPPRALYDQFVHKYRVLNQQLGKDQYIVPYFMSSHPGSDLHAAIELACYLKKTGQRPEQVQDFYPTPGTLSTTMFYTGLDPRTMEPVYVPRSYEEKRMQRALLQFYRKENAPLVRQALRKAGRADLIGYESHCLVWPERSEMRGRTPAQQATGTRAACRGNRAKPKKRVTKGHKAGTKQQLAQRLQVKQKTKHGG